MLGNPLITTNLPNISSVLREIRPPHSLRTYRQYLPAGATFAIERPFPIDGLLFHDRLTEAWPTSLTFQWGLYRRPVKFSLPASADQGVSFANGRIDALFLTTYSAETESLPQQCRKQ